MNLLAPYTGVDLNQATLQWEARYRSHVMFEMSETLVAQFGGTKTDVENIFGDMLLVGFATHGNQREMVKALMESVNSATRRASIVKPPDGGVP